MDRKLILICTIAMISILLQNTMISAIRIDQSNKQIISNTTNNYKGFLYEFKGDGTILLYEKEINPTVLNHIFKDLENTKSIDDQLNVYKKYNLVENSITSNQLKKSFENKIDLYSIRPLNISQFYSLNQFPIRYYHASNIFCEVYGDYTFGIRLLGGLSSIASYINFILFMMSFPYTFNSQINSYYDNAIGSIDVIDVHKAFIGSLSAHNGIGPNFTINSILSTILLIGFVGYYLVILPVPFLTLIGSFVGYSAFAFTAGLLI